MLSPDFRVPFSFVRDRWFVRMKHATCYAVARYDPHRPDNLWGSIKGDVKKKHPPIRRKGSKSLTSRSRPAAATRFVVSLGTLLFMLLVAPAL